MHSTISFLVNNEKIKPKKKLKVKIKAKLENGKESKKGNDKQQKLDL